MLKPGLKTIGLLLAACLAFGCGRTASEEQPESVAKSMTLSADASTIRNAIESSEKDIVMAHIWATWCAPCVKEFPHIVALHDFPPTEQVEFILISADDPDDVESVEQFMIAQGSPWKTYVVNNFNEEVMDVISSEWSGAIPATFFYNRNGEVLKWWEGIKTTEEFEQAISALLEL